MRVLVQHSVQVSDQVVLQYDLVRQQMGEDGECCCVQLRQAVAEVLVRKLVCVRRALEVDLMFVERNVVAVGARLLVLQGFAAALVAFVVDLEGAASALAVAQGATNPPLHPPSS